MKKQAHKAEMRWNEEERLAALRGYNILDTPQETDFDDIVKLAAEICGAPISLISLVEHDRQWFKAKTGLSANQTPIEQSICAHAMLQREVFVVPDTKQDSRFNSNPLVTGDPKLRFYAGAVLETDDKLPLGMLCVLDTVPRTLTEQQLLMLKALARQVMTQLELRKILKQKEENEKRLNLAFNASEFAGFWNWNLETNLLVADARFARMYGIDPKLAARGAPIETYIKNIPAEDVERIRPSVQRTITKGENYAEDYRLIQSDGTVRWLAARGSVQLNEQGKPLSFDGVAIDITERKQNELALRESEEQFRQLADSIPQLAWMADETGYIFWYNQRWYDYTGTVFEDMQGWGWDKVHDPVELPRLLATWKAALASGEQFQETFPLRRFDGQMRWHLTRALPIRNEQGKVVRWFGTNTDITEQREARQLAESANIAKTEFLANMSHEIRTPMNAVIGLSNILALSHPLTQKQQEYIKTLQLSADSLLALINDLLDIAKIEARTVELERISFCLTQMMQEVISMMSVKVKEKNLVFTMDGEKFEKRIFVGDPTRLRQIIVNLCSNAVKFTQKGKIHVGLDSEPSDVQGFENILITVADSGIGIAKDKIDTIFEKFVQADSSISRKYGGTGLGLAITKTLTEIMGGTLSVKSTLGKGSTFTVSLPLKSGEDMDKDDGSSAIHRNGIMQKNEYRILLVEDYAANILVAGSYLESFGYDYDVATNGNEAIEMAGKIGYLAILMDVQMHDMNGFEATQIIRARETQQKTPPKYIIGMTAHALAGDRERCLAAGMNDYISKPFNPYKLQEMLARLEEKKAA